MVYYVHRGYDFAFKGWGGSYNSREWAAMQHVGTGGLPGGRNIPWFGDHVLRWRRVHLWFI